MTLMVMYAPTIPPRGLEQSFRLLSVFKPTLASQRSSFLNSLLTCYSSHANRRRVPTVRRPRWVTFCAYDLSVLLTAPYLTYTGPFCPLIGATQP